MTSLIEQLGGYDIVKQMWIDGGSLKDTQLAFELLEHRRHNNIFEVGDKVFEKYCDDFGILEITNISKDRFTACNDILHSGYDISNNCMSFYVRHCTNKEIAQGFRDE